MRRRVRESMPLASRVAVSVREAFGGRLLRSLAACVECRRLARFRVVDDNESVAPDVAVVGFYHAENGGRGERSVYKVAAAL